MQIKASNDSFLRHWWCRLVLVLSAVLPGHLLADTAQQTVKATILYFQESETGIEPYPVRYLVAGDLLRIDDGAAGDNFLLFDKKSATITSVRHNPPTLMQISPGKQVLPETLAERQKSLKLSERRLDDVKLPDIAGQKVLSYELLSNDDVCVRVSAALELLPEVVSMLGLYEKVLADNTLSSLQNQPAEYITDCLLFNDVLSADAYLSFGFPVALNKQNGLKRLLLNFEEGRDVSAQLFELPDGYRVFELPGARP